MSTGELPVDQIQGALQHSGLEVVGSCATAFGPVRIVRDLGRSFIFRSSTHFGLAVIVSPEGASQRLDTASAAGAVGRCAFG